MRLRLMTGLACTLFGIVALGGEALILDQKWRIQPATKSSIPPDPKRWGSTNAAEWRWGGIDNKGSDWAKIDRKTVHSLWYEQTLALPAAWQGQRCFLDFRRIEGDALVFLNGAKVGELLRPGGEIEITAQAKPGADNQLHVFLTRDYTDISRNFEQDRLRHISRASEYGSIPLPNWPMGITAPVSLLARPRPAAIADAFVQTSVRRHELKIDVDLDAAEALAGLSLSAQVFDQDGALALSFAGPPVRVPAGRSTVTLASPWANPRLWELDGGYLYNVKLQLARGEQVIDQSAPFPFGFREVWTEGRKLVMNGHESRWRLGLRLFSGVNGLHLMRLMGFNASYVQANPSMWWRDWSETPVFDEAELAEMDRLGYAVMLPSPGVSCVRERLCQDEQTRRDFERETALHLRRYRNHPAVLAWTVGMNSYNPRDAISPQGMGRRYPPERLGSGQPQAIVTACAIVKRFDPTRLAYSHADGNLGDIATANLYPNFAPLQEREEWPLAWSQSGDMPYQMAEYGQPLTGNFWKGKRFLPTEYFAIDFGPRAYASETDSSLAATVPIGLATKNSFGIEYVGDMKVLGWKDYPLYRDFEEQIVRNTNRAYRSLGVNCGWAWWMFDGYGDPPGFNPKQGGAAFKRYSPLKEAITGRPAWADPNFDIYSQSNQPFLAYVGGHPVPIDKTHVFFPGEQIEKSLCTVWDGPGDAELKLAWSVPGTAVAGVVEVRLAAGDRKAMPIAFTAPQGDARQELAITLTGSCNGQPIPPDSFAFTVLPRPAPLALRARVALFDPAGKSGPWLEALGVKYTPIEEGASLANVELLIVGREALKAGAPVPWTAAAVQRGLKVLVLEQRPEVWRGFGFRSNEAMPRSAYIVDPANPVFAGLRDADLRYWRGSPDLLPEGRNQPAPTQHAPKWTNRHAVASSIPQIPRASGFVPLAAAEFDLDYAPLLEWRSGRGLVWYSAFDFSGRVGSDPAASLLAANVLCTLDAAAPEPTRRLAWSGGAAGQELLRRLNLDPVPWNVTLPPATTVLAVGADATLEPAAIEAFARAGGRVLLLAAPAARLQALGFAASPAKLQRAAWPDSASPWFRGLGPNLMRWREAIETATADGKVLAQKQIGTGVIVCCQLEPGLLPSVQSGDKERLEIAQTSLWRCQQLVARVLTNLGAEPVAAAADRLGFLDLGPRFEVLKHWNVLGPYHVEREDGEAMLSSKFPGEDMAIAGDSNPNVTFRTADGRALDWRPTVQADADGRVNLAKALQRESLSVAYVVTTVSSGSEREALLRLGCDWRMRVWVNGEEVFKTLQGGNRAAAYTVKVRLKKGENSIGMKVASGSKGHSFFADLGTESPAGAVALPDAAKGVSFYGGSASADEFDPYEYHYW